MTNKKHTVTAYSDSDKVHQNATNAAMIQKKFIIFFELTHSDATETFLMKFRRSEQYLGMSECVAAKCS